MACTTLQTIMPSITQLATIHCFSQIKKGMIHNPVMTEMTNDINRHAQACRSQQRAPKRTLANPCDGTIRLSIPIVTCIPGCAEYRNCMVLDFVCSGNVTPLVKLYTYHYVVQKICFSDSITICVLLLIYVQRIPPVGTSQWRQQQ